MLMRIAASLAPMVTIVAAGYVYGRYRKPNMAIANQLALEIFIPAPVLWRAETMLHFSLGARMVDRHTRLRDFWRIPPHRLRSEFRR